MSTREMLKAPYDRGKWQEFLQKDLKCNILENPQSVDLGKNDICYECSLLGRYDISEYSKIGIYEVLLNENINLVKNRVGLVALLKQLTDQLSGAMIVFIQGDNWRFSFVSKSQTLNKETNTLEDTQTSPKRYTYLLGSGQKVLTASQRFGELAKKSKLTVNDFIDAFSVEKLTKEFYKGVVGVYYKLLSDYLTYPTNNENDKKEFAIRLIGRILFIKFLNKKALVPDDIFVRTEGYYHSKLEPLFFEQLNTPISERKTPFTNDAIPFLNGGLFEPLNLDCYAYNELSECNQHINTLKIDDDFFKDLYEHLDQYNFTIDENSIDDNELSIDPEMLGRVFENLLAEVNPETSQNARKSTGSYYTPREIVNYMCKSSIDTYLEGKDDKLQALKNIKVLDPACGSGAFPMGLLHEIIKQRAALGDVTPMLELKKEIIKNNIFGVDIQPMAIEISKLRFFLSIIVDEDDTPEPLPNLEFKFVCANSLLPLSANEDTGLLQGLSVFDGISSHGFQDKDRLLALKNAYFGVSGADKEAIKSEYKSLLYAISTTQEERQSLLNALENKLTAYDPFDPVSVAGFFDSDFMFNIKDGFDIVIGNPPYLRVQGIDKTESEKYKTLYKSATGSYDLYVIFTEQAIKLLGKNGLVNFIMPHKWVNSAFGKGLREVAKEKFFRFISFREYQVFNASTYTSLVWFKNKSDTVAYIGLEKDLQTNSDLKGFLDSITDDKYTITKNEKLNNDAWTFSDNKVAKVLAKLDKQPLRVSDVFEKVFTGLQTSKDSVYFLSECIENNETIEGYSKELDRRISIEKELVKPLLKGDDVHRYETLKTDRVVIFPYFRKIEEGKEKAELYSEEELQKSFPKGYAYLKECESVLRDRESGRLQDDEFWYRYIYPKNLTLFDKEKLIMPYLSMGCQLSYDKGEFYGNTKCFGLIKKESYKESYKFYLAILNSKVLWFYIQSISAVFSGGYYTFTKDTVSPFPLPKIENIEDTKPFEILVDYIIFLKQQDFNQSDDLKFAKDRLMVAFFERLIDCMVYELYFADELHKENKYFIEPLQKESLMDMQNMDNKLEEIRAIFEKLNDKNHTIKKNMSVIDSVEVVRIIEGKENANN